MYKRGLLRTTLATCLWRIKFDITNKLTIGLTTTVAIFWSDMNGFETVNRFG